MLLKLFPNHPPGLAILFATEMWERFSFYGMRTLLVLYLTKHFLFSDGVSAGIYGAYLGLTYALPVIGGALADRYIGARRAVIFGGILLCMGHLTMALEGEPSSIDANGTVVFDQFAVNALFTGLAFISVGVGFLKPNISVLVGHLYPAGSPKRDTGFTLFYMGINVGALAATLIVGGVGEIFGWGYGFGLAAFGMFIGLGVFIWGAKYLGEAGEKPVLPKGKDTFLSFKIEHLCYAGTIPVVVLAAWMIRHEEFVGWTLVLALLAVVGYLFYVASTQLSKEQLGNITALLILTFFSVTFWALFEQAGSSMTLFTERLVDRSFVGIELTVTSFQSVNPAAIIFFAPFFAGLWTWLSRRNMEPSLPIKFGIGIIFAGLGFGAIALGIDTAGQGAYVWFGWMVIAYILHSFGELCLSPVGLSAVTRLSPMHLTGLMMGSWFLASAFADWLSGQIAKLASIDRSLLDSGDIVQQSSIYDAVFTQLFWYGSVIGLALIILTPLINKLITEVKIQDTADVTSDSPTTPSFSTK